MATPTIYQTLDGRFTIEQSANGAGSWVIYGPVAADQDMPDTYRTLKDARRWLATRIYAANR